MVRNWLKTNSWVLEELGRCVFPFTLCLFKPQAKALPPLKVLVILLESFSFEAILCFSI